MNLSEAFERMWIVTEIEWLNPAFAADMRAPDEERCQRMSMNRASLKAEINDWYWQDRKILSYWQQQESGIYRSYRNEYGSVVWLHERVHYTSARKELGKGCRIQTRRRFIAVEKNELSVLVHEEVGGGVEPIDVSINAWCWSW